LPSRYPHISAALPSPRHNVAITPPLHYHRVGIMLPPHCQHVAVAFAITLRACCHHVATANGENFAIMLPPRGRDIARPLPSQRRHIAWPACCNHAAIAPPTNSHMLPSAIMLPSRRGHYHIANNRNWHNTIILKE
jgi:hypothetical protein